MRLVHLDIYLCSEVIRELDFAAQCRFARETGYDGLEVAPFTLAEDPAALPDKAISELRAIADSEGIVISGLHWLMAAPAGLSITSADPDITQRTIAFGKRLTELCAGLGGRYLVHGSPAQRVLEEGREADGTKRGIAYFAAMAEPAAKAGVRYYIEPLSRRDTRFVNTVEEAVGIVEDIGSDALATMIDCYASASNGDNVVDLLKRWIPGGLIRHVHFNDTNRRGPGEGELSFGPIIDALREVGYEGTSAVEPFEYVPDGPACAARAIGYLEGLRDRRH